MSLLRVIDVPEVELEVSKLINRMSHLCQGYRQVQMRFYNEEINLPSFGRLFELIRQIEMRYVNELVRFQICRGQEVTWFIEKPLESMEKTKPVDMIQIILNLEKDIHQLTLKVNELAWNKSDVALTSFLQDRIILRQSKVIRKRAGQLKDLERGTDEVTPLLTERLNVKFQVEELEQELRLEILRREWRTLQFQQETEIAMIGSTTRF